jgi:ubiquitin-activating enzyme E1
MKFSKLVETVSKKPIPPHAKHLIAEIMVSDADGEDVEVFSCVPVTLELY